MTEYSAQHAANCPKVSVGMPVYSSEKYIVLALDSLLSQSYENIEILISDNGSTDQTEAICRQYAEQDSRVHYYREEENHGVCWNFNRVFELADGKYFKWAASDDICKPRFIECCVAALESDDSIVSCHTRTEKIDASGNLLRDLPDPTWGGATSAEGALARRDATSPKPYVRFTDVLLTSGWGTRSYGVSRTEAMRKTGLLFSSFGSEKVVMAELSLLGRLEILPEPLFLQRVHAEATSCVTTIEEQKTTFAPQLAKKKTFPRLKLLHAYWSAIEKLGPSFTDRLMCRLGVVQYLLQLSKWNRIWNETLRGTSLSATENLEEAMQSSSKHAPTV